MSAVADMEPERNLAGAHLLLIDDNPSDRELLTRELQRAGRDLRITHVTNNQELDVALSRDDYDLAVTDYQLGWSNGLEVLQRIKSRDRARPVIMFTASGSEEIAVEAMKKGLDDYITKTAMNYPHLPHTVAAVLEQSRQRRELVRYREELEETRRTAAERVRVSEDRFRAVQETSPDGFTVLDAVRDEHGEIVDFRWTYLNEAAAHLARSTREQLLGERVLTHHPGNRSAGLFDKYVEVARTGKPWVGEIDYHEDNIHLFARLAIARVGDGVAISTVDVSERRRAELALLEADQQKDEFLAMLAHELRNPLAPIRNGTELLARMLHDNPRAVPVVDIVRRQATHLTRLVDDLLDVSRITRRRIELKHEVLDLAHVVAQAVETVEPQMRARRHHLRVLISYRPAFVNGDFARLLQCLVNLLNNAAKFTEPGGDILVELREQDGRALIEVTDNGIGIPAALLPRIFDLFVQSDQTLDRAQGGLGIGLSVVQRLIEMHGGEVSAHSAGAGKGATFCILLPLVEAPSTRGQPQRDVKLPTARVLVVDDNVDAANTLVMMLTLEGHEARAVHDARRVVAEVLEFRPQYVLLDIGLPAMDGYEVARRVRELPKAAQPRLIALTGYGQPEDRNRAMQAGFDEHLVKPVESHELLAKLAALKPRS